MKSLLILLFIITTVLGYPAHVFAITGPEVEGRSLMLMERTTGTVLFEVNANQRIFPASTTKILTALVMSEHIRPDEIILIGPETHLTPPGSSRAFLVENTHISGINLLRGIIITSGNDTANVIAREVARRVSGNSNISFEEGEHFFAELMNEKAIELGALNSSFVNAHGFHHESHFSTPYDMALIARAALEVPILAQIFAESSYVGPSVIGDIPEGLTLSNYNWNTGNLLLREDSEHYFPYATGMRTGFHNHAQHALVASAVKDGFELIAGSFQSRVDARFSNSISMFNYGFDNYGFWQIQRDGTIVDNINFHNPMLGEVANMDVMVVGDFTDILQRRNFDRVVQRITYTPGLFHFPSDEELTLDEWLDDPRPRLILPIEEGTEIGEILYTINGATVHTAKIVATMSASARTMETDFYFYRARFLEYITSVQSAPVWLVILVIILLILRSIFKLIRRNRRRKMFDGKSDRRLHYRYRRY